ncbi:MAG: EAL domain-containing protein [Pseudomonadota bacterium]
MPTEVGLFLIVVALAAVSFALRQMRRLEARSPATESGVPQADALSAALHNMSNGLVMIAADGTVRLHNDRALELLQLEEDAVRPGVTCADMVRAIGEKHNWTEARIEKAIASHTTWLEKTEVTQTEFYFECGRVLSIVCCPMADGSAVITYHDVTSERRVHAEITHMAYHDALTGLPNLRSFQEELQTALGSQSCRAVLMLDLDRYKAVNDTLGHSIGDALLTEVAQRLRECCRPTDMIFRIGGDEFAILPGRIGRRGIESYGQRIIEVLSKEFFIEGNRIHIGCSIGVAMLDETGADEAEVQIQKADLALYQAKRHGRCRLEFYQDGMIEEAIERRNIEADLNRALAEREFVLHYQPICETASRRLLGFEALVRWRHPERGLLAPQYFIPVAEETGFIKDLGLWILEEACREVATWPEELHIAVNVSPVQLQAPGLVAELAKCLMANRLAPQRVEVELTETALVGDSKGVREVLTALRALGVRIAMDDFGTGYSSLSHLRDFAVDRIKIDQSFINRPADDFGAACVVRAVTNIARDLNVTTVAEGVETAEQLERLTELGCDSVQGFLLGRPLDREGAKAMILAESAAQSANAALARASA